MSSQLSSERTADAYYSPEERSLLLQVAHRAILAALDEQSLDLTPPTARLAEARGAFTTLHLDGSLRGCVGYILAAHPLYRTIAETAQAAAFHDYRFLPVSREEAPRLKIEISVLSPLHPISAEEIEIGRHGLMVTCGSRRGLLLPQVPLEYGWSRETFLQQTCVKAGLSPDAWHSDTKLESFTAEIFSD